MASEVEKEAREMKGLALAIITALTAGLVLLAGSRAPVSAQPLANIALPEPGGVEQLYAGCNNISLTFPDGTPSQTVVQAVNPAGTVETLWRFNGPENRFEGYSPAYPQASDLMSVNSLDAVWICMAEAAPGVTDTEILLGSTQALTGQAAVYGVSLKAGMDAYFAYVNDSGGVNGRKIRLIVYDDQYSEPLISEGMQKLVGQDKVFAVMGELGGPPYSAAWNYLEASAVPNMFVLSGESKVTDPVVRTRFAMAPDYIEEGRILGEYIAKSFPGKKLGIIAQNAEFGQEGEKGLRDGVKDANMQIVSEYVEMTQNDLAAQVQRLQNQNVDVMAIYADVIQAASAIKNAHETLNWKVPIVVTGADALDITGVLAGYDNIEGTVSVVYGHQAFEKDVPGIAQHWDIMAKYAPGVTPFNLTVVGATVAEVMTDILRRSGPDLTREKFLDTAESTCKWQGSTGLAPVSMSPTDHRAFEVEQYVRATTDKSTDPPTFAWKPFGDPVNFESTKDCTPEE
jgi:branched-chain amino acid transport system substrate-binding protein